MSTETAGARSAGERVLEEYAGESADELPVKAYFGLMLAFVSTFGSLLIAAGRRGALPRRMRAGDIALLGVATHRLTRVVTRDRVAAPLRMPFTRYEGTAGAGELKETPRGRGIRRALGSLLTCQYCAGPWIASVLAVCLVERPRETRMAAGVLAAVTVSDFLHQLYWRVRR
jgi:hypothetical protein